MRWSNAQPGRFFKLTPSAKGTLSNWLGVFLDTSGDAAVDWDEISEILEVAFRLVAPASAVALLGRTWPFSTDATPSPMKDRLEPAIFDARAARSPRRRPGPRRETCLYWIQF